MCAEGESWQAPVVEVLGLTMANETRTLTIAAYRDAAGAPTCCANWDTARCRFLATRKLGLVEVCGATGQDLHRRPADWQRGDIVARPDDHLLRPADGCPVWAE
jgi:hypothetical protein